MTTTMEEREKARQDGDFEKFCDLDDIITAGYAEVIRETIDSAGKAFTNAERYVLRSEADMLADLMAWAGVDLDQGKKVVAEHLRGLISSPLQVKCLVACLAESALNPDLPPVDGIVGTAVDNAMTTLRPYLVRSGAFA